MPEISPSKYMVQAGWEHAPHLDEKTKAELMRSTPPYLREARFKGIPTMGAGRIYPLAWEDVACDPFRPPDFWRRGFGLDVGWTHPTAAIWLAEDPNDGTLYAYSEYRQGDRKVLEHSTALKARGPWMTGAVDPSANNSTIADGKKIVMQYRGQGVKLAFANNAVAAGVDYLWTLMSTGRLRFFSTLVKTEREFLNYRRVEKKDENGVTRSKIVKVDDDLMDALRYGVMTFDKIASVRPVEMTDYRPAPPKADRLAGY